MNKKILFILIGILTFGMAAYGAELNPLATDRAETVGAGKLRLDVTFSAESLPDTSLLLHTPGFGLTWGLSDNTDFIFKYGGYMFREWPDDSESSGSGDVIFGLKVSPWKGSWGRLGFLVATKLPNADDTYGLGTDEQDFFVTGLYTATIKNLKLNFNAGLAIIGDNEELRRYDYLFAYGAGFEYLITDHWSIVGDVAGTTGGSDKNEIAEATLGVVGPLAWGWEWAVTGSYGLTVDSPEWTAGLSLSRVWEVGPDSAGPFFTEKDPSLITYLPFPMHTKEAWTIAPSAFYGSLVFSAAGYEDGSTLLDIPYKDFRIGLAGGADFGVAFSSLFLIDSPIHEDNNAISNIRVSFKVAPWEFGNFRLGLYTEAKLPTDNYHGGLDSGKMDYTGLAVVSYAYKNLALHANLGLAIEGDPDEYSSQKDLFVLGLGAEYAITDRISVFGEFYGKLGETDDSSYMAGGGVRFLVGKYALFVSGQAGFGDPDPDYMVTVGIMRVWNF